MGRGALRAAVGSEVVDGWGKVDGIGKAGLALSGAKTAGTRAALGAGGALLLASGGGVAAAAIGGGVAVRAGFAAKRKMYDETPERMAAREEARYQEWQDQVSEPPATTGPTSQDDMITQQQEEKKKKRTRVAAPPNDLSEIPRSDKPTPETLAPTPLPHSTPTVKPPRRIITTPTQRSTPVVAAKPVKRIITTPTPRGKPAPAVRPVRKIVTTPASKKLAGGVRGSEPPPPWVGAADYRSTPVPQTERRTWGFGTIRRKPPGDADST